MSQFDLALPVPETAPVDMRPRALARLKRIFSEIEEGTSETRLRRFECVVPQIANWLPRDEAEEHLLQFRALTGQPG